MKSTHLLVVSALVAGIAFPLGAAAQSEGLYISGGIGAAIPNDSDIDGTGINASADLNPSVAGSVAIGTTFLHNWRSELELSYRDVDVDNVSGTAASTGDVSGTGLLLNGFYDFKNDSNWTPYLGAGAGPMRVSFNSVSPVGGSSIDDSDWTLAWQLIAGVGYKISDHLGVYTDYHYLDTTGVEFQTNTGTRVDSEYSEHRVMVGLRWSFGAPKAPMKPEPVQAPAAAPAPPPPPKAAAAPPPAPTPPPAPQVARKYLLFFDWDRYNLTDDARAIVKAAADASKKIPVTVIEATGHADRSGPDSYNMGLSKRRAESVKAELIKLGVPAEEIVIMWKGERDPLVPTADGVREPQNRRVEIVLK